MFILLILIVQAAKLSLMTGVMQDDCQQLYENALKDSKTPELNEIAYNLTILRNDNQNLTFNSNKQIKLVFPSVLSLFPNSIQNVTLYSDTFVTVYPELKNSCKGFDQLRLVQFLGLSPETEIDGIIEIFVNLEDVFRGCPDPEIYDSECQLSILLIGQDPGLNDVPWYCGDKPVNQVSDRVCISQAHFDWMCERWQLSYLNNDLYINRPWTGLGYTYDWGSEYHFGLSEFVLLAFTEVEFYAKYNISEYCS